jgi:signal peptidase I
LKRSQQEPRVANDAEIKSKTKDEGGILETVKVVVQALLIAW